MAHIVLGIATSHGPMLSTPPQAWGQRVEADRTNPAHFYRGKTYTFDELAELRRDEALDRQVTEDIWVERHAACRRALGTLAEVFDRVRPDVTLIFGNDQMELFGEENVPAFAVYWGGEILNEEYSSEHLRKMPPGISVSVPGHIPPGGASYPGHPELAKHLIREVQNRGFDVAALKRFPQHHPTIPHAFGFVYRQIMNDLAVPSVPLFINTFYPPNQPNAHRCLSLGEAVLAAVKSWPGSERVALIASGGLSHFVIDEELDNRILNALQSGDTSILGAIPDCMYQSGSSEIKNWIPLAGAMSALGWPVHIVDYVPCYRSLAGTGNAMGFAWWDGVHK